jgi:hypothetical protein
MPSGYALAWVDWSRRVAVCYPWPANWLARQWREFVWRIARAARALRGPGREGQEVANAQRIYRERQILAEEFAAGYLIGWQESLDACVEAIEEQVEHGGMRKFAKALASLPVKTGRSQALSERHAEKRERTKLN